MDKETILAGPPYMGALLQAGMSPDEIEAGAQMFLSGEWVPRRNRAEEDPELVKQIEEQDSTSISGVLLEICQKTAPGSATRKLAISRFIFLASGGKGPQVWCN
jgi:hypothetical protein